MQYLLLFNSKNNSRTRLNVTLYVHCLVLWLFRWDISGNQRVEVRLLRIWSFIGEQTPWIESVKILSVKLKSAKNLFPVVLVYFHTVQGCINTLSKSLWRHFNFILCFLTVTLSNNPIYLILITVSSKIHDWLIFQCVISFPKKLITFFFFVS
jgi:hypothetical protein